MLIISEIRRDGSLGLLNESWFDNLKHAKSQINEKGCLHLHLPPAPRYLTVEIYTFTSFQSNHGLVSTGLLNRTAANVDNCNSHLDRSVGV